jgi:hypothetical protein
MSVWHFSSSGRVRRSFWLPVLRNSRFSGAATACGGARLLVGVLSVITFITEGSELF